MIGGKVFDYQIREIFGEVIASPEVDGNELHYQRGVFANISHHDNFPCFKASLSHSIGRIVANDFIRFKCCECGGWWLTHGAVIRMMAMGAKVPSNIAGIFWSRHPKLIAGNFPRPPDSNFASASSSSAFSPSPPSSLPSLRRKHFNFG